jgi:hypothetical protein
LLRRNAASLLPAAAEALAGPPVLHKVFGRSGTLCRRVACKGRGQVPALPEAGSPLQATTRPRCCSHRVRVRGRHDGRHSLSRRFTHPCNPLWSPTGGPSRRGSARLACARPAVGVRSLRHAPCTHGPALASLRGRSSLVDRPAAGPHMHHAAASAVRRNASTSCIDPTRKARDRAVAPRPASPPGQPPAGWPKGQRRPP